MNKRTRRGLDTAHRVFDLSQKHATDIQAYVETMALFKEKLAQADALAEQQEAGDQDAGVAREVKDILREKIETEYVSHMARIARTALPNDPALRRRFRPPNHRLSRQDFVSAMRAMLAAAAARKDVFIAAGMAPTFVEDLETLLTEYLGAISEKNFGEALRVGAVAELPVVVKELGALTRVLDAINKKRWAKNPQLLAAWRSAKDVNWPHVKPEPDPDGTGGKGKGETAA